MNELWTTDHCAPVYMLRIFEHICTVGNSLGELILLPGKNNFGLLTLVLPSLPKFFFFFFSLLRSSHFIHEHQGFASFVPSTPFGLLFPTFILNIRCYKWRNIALSRETRRSSYFTKWHFLCWLLLRWWQCLLRAITYYYHLLNIYIYIEKQ